MKTLIRIAALALTLSIAPASPGLTRITATPYESHFQRVRGTLAALPEKHASLAEIERLVRIGYGFRYRHSHPYIPRPADEVERTGYGDCKDKALWLATRETRETGSVCEN